MTEIRSAEDLTRDPDDKEPVSPIDGPQKTNDPRALKAKAISDKQRELQDDNDLKAVLATPAGVRFMARLIGGPCGWNMPHFNPNAAVMSEIAGRRSIAYQLEQWISDADLKLWFAVRTELERLRSKSSTVATGPKARA